MWVAFVTQDLVFFYNKEILISLKNSAYLYTSMSMGYLPVVMDPLNACPTNPGGCTVIQTEYICI